jgi:hypothetical protein
MKTTNLIQKLISFLLPRLGEIFFIALFAAVIGLGPRMMNIDGDLGRHITLGNYIIDNRDIPTEDIFSFTKYGDPLTPHEWLSDLIFAAVNKAVGLDGVVWLTALILAGSLWLVYKYSLNLSNMSLIALLGGVLGAAASSLHWLTRPHIFTILLAAVWTGELEKMRLGVRKSWLIFPLLMLIWVNLHGAFIAGLLIWACYFIGMLLDQQISLRKNQAFLWIGLSSLLVSLVNPDGFGIWKTGFGFLGNQYLVSHTAEYLPPDFQQLSFWPFLVLILCSVFVLGLSNKRMPFPHLFIVGGWTIMALYSARNIPLYVVTVIPILISESCGILCDWNDSILIEKFLDFQKKIASTEESLKGGFWSVISVALTLIMLVSGMELDFQKNGNRFSEDVFPVNASAWLEQNPPEGNGFNYFPWGGYLLYRFWPERNVFIDGQTDFYGEEFTREYEQVITLADGWQGVLREYEITWVIMPAGSELGLVLDDNDFWTREYEDSTAVIWMHSD